jgi:hypothetical protein
MSRVNRGQQWIVLLALISSGCGSIDSTKARQAYEAELAKLPQQERDAAAQTVTATCTELDYLHMDAAPQEYIEEYMQTLELAQKPWLKYGIQATCGDHWQRYGP